MTPTQTAAIRAAVESMERDTYEVLDHVLPAHAVDWRRKFCQFLSLLDEVERLTAERDVALRRAEVAEAAVTSLTKGEYAICDMCALFGESDETTACLVGCYLDNETGESCSLTCYPDEPCDDFKYKGDPAHETR